MALSSFGESQNECHASIHLMESLVPTQPGCGWGGMLLLIAGGGGASEL